MYSYDNSGSSLYACSGEASGSRGHMEVQGDRAGNGVYGSPSGSSSDTHEVENEDRSPRATMTSMPKRTRRQRRSNNFGGSESDNSMLLQIRRAKGEISCAECRRLKLRCDKSLPCGSCVRRGCPVICPNGVLSPGQGSRYVLANTTELHQKLDTMCNRIRALEDALSEASYALNSSRMHPLLRPELLEIKHYTSARFVNRDERKEREKREKVKVKDGEGAMEVDRKVLKSFEKLIMEGERRDTEDEEGVPASDEDSTHPYLGEYGRRASGESEVGMNSSPSINHPSLDTSIHPTESRYQILEKIQCLLPTYEHAKELCESYLTNIGWFLQPVPREQIFDELLPRVYSLFAPSTEQTMRRRESLVGENYYNRNEGVNNQGINQGYGSAGSPSSLVEERKSGFENGWEQELAAFLVILSLGVIGELGLSPATPETELLVHWAQVLQSLNPAVEGLEILKIQTAMLLRVYDLFSMIEEKPKRMEWIGSFASTLALNQNLHQEQDKEDVDPAVVQRRRHVFWEMRALEVWTSLITGKAPYLHPDYIDCKFPQYVCETSDGVAWHKLQNFRYWKHRFIKDILETVVLKLSSARTLKYVEILEMDQQIKEFALNYKLNNAVSAPVEVPAHQQNGGIEAYVLNAWKEFTLLTIHRNFLANSLIVNPSNPIHGEFSPSFFSAFNSAMNCLHVVRSHVPVISPGLLRCRDIWKPLVDSAVVAGSVAARAPLSGLGQKAYKEFSEALSVMENMRFHPAVQAKIPLLRRLHSQAYQALLDAGMLPQHSQTEVSQQANASYENDLELRQNRAMDFNPDLGTSMNQCHARPYVSQPQLSQNIATTTRSQETMWQDEGFSICACNGSVMPAEYMSTNNLVSNNESSASHYDKSSIGNSWNPGYEHSSLANVITIPNGYTTGVSATDASAPISDFSGYLTPNISPSSKFEVVDNARGYVQRHIFNEASEPNYEKHNIHPDTCGLDMDLTSPPTLLISKTSKRVELSSSPLRHASSLSVQGHTESTLPTGALGPLGMIDDLGNSKSDCSPETSAFVTSMKMDEDGSAIGSEYPTSGTLIEANPSSDRIGLFRAAVETEMQSQAGGQGYLSFDYGSDSKESLATVDVIDEDKMMGPFSAPVLQEPMQPWSDQQHPYQVIGTIQNHQVHLNTGINNVLQDRIK